MLKEIIHHLKMWNTHETCIYYVPSASTSPASSGKDEVGDDSSLQQTSLPPTRAMAGFDLDSTLTISKSGRQFTQDADDSIWAFESVPSKLKEFQDSGFTIVIFTNQARFTNSTKQRIDHVRQSLGEYGVHPFIFIATADDNFRKPETGMRDLFKSLVEIEDDKVFSDVSFYVGDAAGSESDYPPYTWASSDLEFAEYCGILFYVPKDIFPQPQLPTPNPSSTQEVILLVGNQGSGKSSTAAEFSKDNPNYVVISQDQYKTKDKVKRQMEIEFKSGKSVIIDRTNPAVSDRAEFISLAKQFGAKSIRIWWLARDGRPFNELRPKPVSKICYNIYSKNFEVPTEEEGNAVERIN